MLGVCSSENSIRFGGLRESRLGDKKGGPLPQVPVAARPRRPPKNPAILGQIPSEKNSALRSMYFKSFCARIGVLTKPSARLQLRQSKS